jgi:hypothetical protein
MSTNAHRHTTRLRAGLLALSALIAIGVALVFLALTGANHTITPTSSITATQPTSHPAATTVTSQAPRGYYRDPTTHALLRQGTSGTGAGDGPIDPGYGYGGHPERGYRPALAAAELRRAAADRATLTTGANPRGVAILPPEKSAADQAAARP